MEMRVRIEGLDEFKEAMRGSGRAVNEGIIEALNYLTKDVERRAKQFAPVGRVAGGRLRSDIKSDVNESGLYGRVFNDVHYAIYVHEGTRPSPGRYVPAIGKRVRTGMHPGQRPQRYMKQAVDYIKGKVGDIMAKRIQKRLDLITKRGLTARR